jgi:hypothetical protein
LGELAAAIFRVVEEHLKIKICDRKFEFHVLDNITLCSAHENMTTSHINAVF